MITVCPEIVSDIFSLIFNPTWSFFYFIQERFNHNCNLIQYFNSDRIMSTFIVRDLQYQKESELDANSAPVASVVANAYSLIYDIDVHFPVLMNLTKIRCVPIQPWISEKYKNIKVRFISVCQFIQYKIIQI